MELGCFVVLMLFNLVYFFFFNLEIYKFCYIFCSYVQLYGRYGKIDLEFRFFKERKVQFVNVFGGYILVMVVIIFNFFVINKFGGLIFYKVCCFLYFVFFVNLQGFSFSVGNQFDLWLIFGYNVVKQ